MAATRRASVIQVSGAASPALSYELAVDGASAVRNDGRAALVDDSVRLCQA